MLFVQAPRTGCTAIAHLLMDRFAGEQLPAEDIIDERGKFAVPRKHSSIAQLLSRQLIPEDYASQFVTFTSVRNPFDSLASLYVKKRDKYVSYLADKNSWVYRIPGYVEDMEFCRTHSFEEWLSEHYEVGWKDRLLGRGRRSLYAKYTKGVRVVMRFEQLQEDFRKVMHDAGVDGDVVIPRINETPRRKTNYQSYYTPRARKLVEYVFAPDLDRYGYSFDGLNHERVSAQSQEA